MSRDEDTAKSFMTIFEYFPTRDHMATNFDFYVLYKLATTCTEGGTACDMDHTIVAISTY